jgi:hypothetical protein
VVTAIAEQITFEAFAILVVLVRFVFVITRRGL